MKRAGQNRRRLMAIIVALPLLAQANAQANEPQEIRPVIRRLPPPPARPNPDLARLHETAKKRAAAEERFVQDTVHLFANATNLKLIDGKRRVAIVTNSTGDLAQAQSIARRLQELAFPRGSLSAEASRLGEGTDLGEVSSVVILQYSRSDFSVLRAYGATPGVLMISRRPQDLGVFAIVVLHGEVFVDETLLNGVRFVHEGRAPTKLDVRTIDYLEQFRKARIATEKRRAVVDWDEVIKRLRLAILKQPAEDETPIPIVSSWADPYLPHYFLSQALANVGDCEGARAAQQRSRSETRKKLAKDTQDKIEALFRDRCRVSLEGRWATASF